MSRVFGFRILIEIQTFNFIQDGHLHLGGYMVRTAEIEVAHILSMFQGHAWLHFKVKMLERVLQDFDSFFTEIGVENEKSSLIHEMIRLEIIVTTVHYAEVVAANLLAFKTKHKRYHKKLLSYSVSAVNDFYKKIKQRQISYIADLLGYPPLHQISDVKAREQLERSCKKVREMLSEVADHYNKYRLLYNAYKHGFRIGVAKSAPPDAEPYPFILYLPQRGEFDTVTLARTSLQKEIAMSDFMFSVLESVTQTFTQRVLKGEEKWTARVWE